MGFILLNSSVVYNGIIWFSFCLWHLATGARCLALTQNSGHDILVIEVHPVSRACASESKCIQLCVYSLAHLRLWLCVLGSHVRSTCRRSFWFWCVESGIKCPMSVLGIWCLAFRFHGPAQLRAHGSEFGALGLESRFCFGSAPGSRFQSHRSVSRILSWLWCLVSVNG